MEAEVWQEDCGYEVIDGETVMMSPRPAVGHNRIAGKIYHIFMNYLKGRRCIPFVDGVDVHLDEKNTFVPDVMIVCNRDIIRPDGIYGAPDLVVEVLSPSTMNNDLGRKKDVYERAGVKEYWIVSPVEKAITVYRLQEGRFVLDYAYAVYPDWDWARMTEEERAQAQLSLKVSLYDDFVIDIREIFEDI